MSLAARRNGMSASTAQRREALPGKPRLLIVTGPARSGQTTAL
jgi:type II secretory ATPase GspE/PulE/Tfp pilus assembly ATPase PilB-like protein